MSGNFEHNPYVGPRSIQQGEPLYGRNREVNELYDLLQARRVVVLHSPSGAGKSSLVQAGLIPRLEVGEFDVWKPVRVNLDPAGLDGIAEDTNRYLLSAMSSLEEELPEDRRRSAAELSKLDLCTYLETRPRRRKHRGRPVVLLFDQFEELLTIAPRAVAAKRRFFIALGKALKNERYWALLIIREDFLAAFAPYRDHLPTQMANTFRLDLLNLEGAREAAEQPALAGGRTFPAVDKLIRDLSTIQVQQTDGSFVVEQGIYVEPVQLQVVCRRLWATMPASDRRIEDRHIAEYASVSDSLAEYYAQSVAEVAGPDLAAERALREWFTNELIVGGIRSQVRQGVGESGGLDNELIRGLLDSYLVRTEQRAGATWFELSHDRLVEPVLQNNGRWEREHLHPVQVQAKLWENERRPPKHLLSQEMLGEAMAWAEQHAGLLTESERDFLRLSRELRAEQRRRQIAWVSVLVLMLVAVTVVSIVMAKKNEEKKTLLEEKTRLLGAQTRLLGEQTRLRQRQGGLSASLLAKIPGRELEALKLAIESFGAFDTEATPQDQVLAGLRTALLNGEIMLPLVGHPTSATAVAFSADGKYIATVSSSEVRLWDATTGRPIQVAGRDLVLNEASDPEEGDADRKFVAVAFSPDTRSIIAASKTDEVVYIWTSPEGDWSSFAGDRPAKLSHAGPVLDVVFSSDGARLATVRGGENNAAHVWRFDPGADEEEPLVTIPSTSPFTSVAFSPDGERLATASEDGQARVWDAGAGVDHPLATLVGHEGVVHAVAYSPAGARIATAGEDGTARVWDAATGDQSELLVHGEVVKAVSFSPGGDQLATATVDDTAAHLWDLATATQIASYRHREPVLDVVFAPDGRRLATVSLNESPDLDLLGLVRLWTINRGAALVSLEGHADRIDAVAISPDGSRIATASRDNSARVWDADTGALTTILRGHDRDLSAVAFSSDGAKLATASWDGTARLWDTETGAAITTLDDGEGWIRTVAFSPVDATRVVTGGGKTVRVWDVTTGAPLHSFEHDDRVVEIALAPSGRLLTVTKSFEARVWDVASGEESFTLGFSVQDAVFSPDGRKIAAAVGNTIQLLDADRGAPMGEPIRGHSGPIVAVVFSLDGEHLATASEDDTARVWTIKGKEVASFEHEPVQIWDSYTKQPYPRDGAIAGLALSPNAERLVTVGDENARVWVLAHRPWLDWGCQTLDARREHNDDTRKACPPTTPPKAFDVGDVNVVQVTNSDLPPRFWDQSRSGLELVEVPAGTLELDSGPQEVDSFYLARTEVTNAQYARYIRDMRDQGSDVESPYMWNFEVHSYPNQPIVGLTWDDASAYCEWANLTLPTEVQWRYAARAGRSTQYWFGDVDGEDETEALQRVGWFDSEPMLWVRSVGKKDANPSGLHDMYGGVSEFLSDQRYIGGDWQSDASEALSAGPSEDIERLSRAGFRCSTSAGALDPDVWTQRGSE